MNDEWIVISSNNKKKSHKTELNKKTMDDILNIILNIICPYKPEYIFLYGSRARQTHRDNSDVDLMVFWKYPIPSSENVLYLKKLLINSLGLNIDFVNMYITNKIICVYDERTLCYYDNVSRDAICIYTKNNIKNDINDLLNVSDRIKY
jgi:predicted nucleotidyltransferase